MGLAFASRQSYAQLLQGYLAMYRPFEKQMEALPAETHQLLDWPSRRKQNLLEQDLKWLQPVPLEHQLSVQLPDLGDINATLGALYVVEGSCLGGQVLYRRLQESLALDREHGASFFYGYGEHTGAMWKAFTCLLRQQVTDCVQAADAACAMFQIFEQTLVQSLA